MQYGDRGQDEAKFAPKVMQAHHQQLARDVRGHAGLGRSRRRGAADGVGRPDVLPGVHAIIQMAIVGRAGVNLACEVDRVRKVGARV